MALARSFLNRSQVEHDGKRWFFQSGYQHHLPDVSVAARRAPHPKRLGAHTDSGAGTLAAASHQQVFASVFNGKRRAVRSVECGTIVPKLKSIRWITPQNARYFAPSVAGPRSPDMLPGQGYFMSSLSREAAAAYIPAAPAAG